MHEAAPRTVGGLEDGADDHRIDPSEAMTGVLARMDARLEELESTGDRRRVFLIVYRAMTEEMARRLPSAKFLDPDWTLSLTTRFAGMYFEADEAYEGKRDCPQPWQRAFELSGAPRTFVLEHALLGINAHISYDLPRAVAATILEYGDNVDGPTLPIAAKIARRRYDYEIVNHLLAATTDPVQNLLKKRLTPLLRVIDFAALRFDEYLAELALRFVRGQGWHMAVALAFAQSTEEEDLIRENLVSASMEMMRRIDVVSYLPHPLLRRAARFIREPFVPA